MVQPARIINFHLLLNRECISNLSWHLCGTPQRNLKPILAVYKSTTNHLTKYYWLTTSPQPPVWRGEPEIGMPLVDPLYLFSSTPQTNLLAATQFIFLVKTNKPATVYRHAT